MRSVVSAKQEENHSSATTLYTNDTDSTFVVTYPPQINSSLCQVLIYRIVNFNRCSEMKLSRFHVLLSGSVHTHINVYVYSQNPSVDTFEKHGY